MADAEPIAYIAQTACCKLLLFGATPHQACLKRSLQTIITGNRSASSSSFQRDIMTHAERMNEARRLKAAEDIFA